MIAPAAEGIPVRREVADVDVRLVGLTKRFDDVVALDDVSLEIERGRVVARLGPSGCGKTTTLRMIGGFEEPTSGLIELNGQDVTTVSANRRPVNMVFQQYALFPHMSVYDNVAFGLSVKRVPRSEHRPRIEELLRVVSLEGLERRKPRQLSGGQQQRVALARALVNRPAALLLDEPLGALDVKLRRQMQLELKRIQHELGTTFVYVTHDQEEALAMSDRIAVMNGGRIAQIGSPREIYEHPVSDFVADFVGTINVLDLAGVRETVRPERIKITKAGGRLDGVVADVVYLGVYRQFHVDTDAGRVVSVRLADEPLEEVTTGSHVSLSWD